jgi:hypothetical protein
MLRQGVHGCRGAAETIESSPNHPGMIWLKMMWLEMFRLGMIRMGQIKWEV